ncbi:MAG: addiction module protein, partial [Verrucomicrobia bacterium]|nr:addiction module protein [Verrucomicrobiota bacterium]
MTVTAEKVVFEAMSLSPQARAFVAERLIESLDASPGEALSTAWRDELRKRCQEMDEGNVELREASDVFAKAHSIRFHPDAEAEMLDVFTHISFWTWVHVDAGWVFRAFPAPKGL